MTTSKPATGRKRMPRAERERQMIDVAVQVFAEHGYVAASMDEIAHRVGVSKPMLYEYFDSKEGLLLAAIRDARTQLAKVVAESVVGAESAEDALNRGLLAYFRYMHDRRDAWSLLRHQLGFLGSSAADELEAIRREQSDLNSMLIQAYKPGAPAREIEAASEILVGACERMAVWCERNGEITPEIATKYTMDVIWGGLAAMQSRYDAPALGERQD